jgi:DNA polymerase III alpha subunit
MLDVLRAKYPTDPALQHLGTLSELETYLAEEKAQAELQNFDLNSVNSSTKNKNNVIYHYLAGKAPIPKYLHHTVSDPDFPDIDFDSSPRGRNAIRAYFEYRFGKDHVMSVATFSRASVRGGMQDVGDAIGIPRSVTIPLTAHFAEMDEEFETTEEELTWLEEQQPEVKELFEENPQFKEWIEKYGELIRSTGQHAAALVISREPIPSYLPVIRGKEDAYMIGYNKEELQPQGAIKYDFLGLNNIDIIAWACRFIQERHGLVLDEDFWFKVGYDHPDVYQLACKGELDGIFQLEGPAGKITTRIVQPQNFDDIAFINAGMRPGASKAGAPKMFHEHSQGKRDPEKYPDIESLKQYGVDEAFLRIMRRTFGIFAYQEQQMMFLHHVGGISLPDTNKVRKVITKTPEKRGEKEAKVLADSQAKYLAHTAEIGIPQDLSVKLWDIVIGQAGYAFNASHCYAYSVLSFRELFIKAKFPSEFFAALIQTTANEKKNDKKKTNKLAEYIAAAKRMGVEVLPTDINFSKGVVTFEGSAIRLGFDKVKYLSTVAIKTLEGLQPFISFDDFLDRTYKTPAGNKRVVEALIFSGALDSFGFKRNQLLQTFAQKRDIEEPTYSIREFLEFESDYLGYAFKVSFLDVPDCFPLDAAIGMDDFENLRFSALIESHEIKVNKKFELYLSLKLHNFRTTITASMWTKQHERFLSRIDNKAYPEIFSLQDGYQIVFLLQKKGKYYNVSEIQRVLTAVGEL